MPDIIFDKYGKTRVRLTYVKREGQAHQLKELTVRILFSGDFDSAFKAADNSNILPTDTMKNTVYATARLKGIVSIEQFALDLANRFLSQVADLREVEVEIEETPWQSLGTYGSAFIQTGNERRVATCTVSRTSAKVVAGVISVHVLKTSDSGFSGFQKDDYTTLRETEDRLLGTMLTADWTYDKSDIDFDAAHSAIRNTLLAGFAKHQSRSVQHTLYDMAAATLEAFPIISEIHLIMPNKHCLLVDLSPFGMDNPNQIFVPIDEPSGYIEASVRR